MTACVQGRSQNSFLPVCCICMRMSPSFIQGWNEWSEGLLHSFFIGQQHATDDCQAANQLGDDHFLPEEENGEDSRE